MKTISVLVALLVAVPAFAKLPAPSEADKAKAAEAASKTAWSDKVDAYKTCLAGDRAAENFRRNAAADKKIIPEPNPGVARCTDPGPYVSTVADAKPLEASGAHSPPGLATSPPSSNATTAELNGGVKKTSPN
jgi:hypothetical protein